MRRAHDGHDVERAIAQQAVGMCGDRARVHQPCVRRDEGDEIAVDIPRRAGEVAIDGSGERLRLVGYQVPATAARRSLIPTQDGTIRANA